MGKRDFQWGGITGLRYFADPKERLIGLVFMQGPSQRAAYLRKTTIAFDALFGSPVWSILDPKGK